VTRVKRADPKRPRIGRAPRRFACRSPGASPGLRHSTCVPNDRHAPDAPGATASAPAMINTDRVVWVNLVIVPTASSRPARDMEVEGCRETGAAGRSALCRQVGGEDVTGCGGRYAVKESRIGIRYSAAAPGRGPLSGIELASGPIAEGTAMEAMEQTVTLLDLVNAVAEHARSEAEVIATIVCMVNEGRVRFCGTFKGARFDLTVVTAA